MLVGSIGTTHTLSSPLTDESLISLLLSEPLWAASAAHRHIIEYCFRLSPYFRSTTSILKHTEGSVHSRTNRKLKQQQGHLLLIGSLFLRLIVEATFWWPSSCCSGSGFEFPDALMMPSPSVEVCSSRVCLCFVFHCIRFEMRLRWRGDSWWWCVSGCCSEACFTTLKQTFGFGSA